MVNALDGRGTLASALVVLLACAFGHISSTTAASGRWRPHSELSGLDGGRAANYAFTRIEGFITGPSLRTPRSLTLFLEGSFLFRRTHSSKEEGSRLGSGHPLTPLRSHIGLLHPTGASDVLSYPPFCKGFLSFFLSFLQKNPSVAHRVPENLAACYVYVVAAGSDIERGDHTVDEAKELCDANEFCMGFTFSDPDGEPKVFQRSSARPEQPKLARCHPLLSDPAGAIRH